MCHNLQYMQGRVAGKVLETETDQLKVDTHYLLHAMYLWFSQLYNWPLNSDLLLINSLLELIYF